MIRVLHTIPNIGRISAGPSASVMSLCNGLQDSVQITLASTDHPDLEKAHSFIKVFPNDLFLTRIGSSRGMYSWIKDSLQNQDFDLIHNHSLWLLQNLYPSWAASKFDTPIIISPRGTLAPAALKSGSRLKTLYWHLLQRQALQKASYFHATSLAEMADIRTLGFKQPIILIPNGVSTASHKIIHPKGHAPRKKILFLGRIHPIKGLSNLIKAWSIIESTNPDWDLEIVGPDLYKHLRALKNLALELSTQRVIFSNEVSGDEKQQKFLSANIVILPSYSENFGMVVAEALSYGIPCITSTGTPWQELPLHGGGWWTENNIKALAGTMQDALSLPSADLEVMGKAGRDWMARDFSWDGICSKWIAVYDYILNNGEKPEYIYE